MSRFLRERNQSESDSDESEEEDMSSLSGDSLSGSDSDGSSPDGSADEDWGNSLRTTMGLLICAADVDFLSSFLTLALSL